MLGCHEMKDVRLLVLAVALVSFTAGTVPAVEPVEFTPQAGFGGQSRGDGSLKFLFGRDRPFHVDSLGTQQPDGTFRLEQTVTFEGEPPQQRVWLLVTTAPGAYAGTLSDAAGPVGGATSGRELSLRYRAAGPVVMHQELRLRPDGRTIDNVGTLTFLGLPIGHLRETIVRQNPAGSAP